MGEHRSKLMHYICITHAAYSRSIFCTHLIGTVSMHVVKCIAQCSVQVSNMSPKVSNHLKSI